MTTWVVGDVHGQARALSVLLDKMSITSKDRFIFLGDYLNKGPDAPSVIRMIRDLPNVRAILGNHDLHGLALYYGYKRSGQRGMGYDQINAQKDRDDLWAWLAQGELMVVDDHAKWIAVHAGLYPSWSLADIHRIIDIKSHYSWEQLLGDEVWRPEHAQHVGSDKDYLRNCIAICTMVRYIATSGALVWDEYRPPPQKGMRPWFEWSHGHDDYDVYFGHWAAMSGYHQPGFRQLDGGAAYGKILMAYAVDENQLLEVPISED